ncbi:MAG: VOC family protein [Pseudomonadota bacterium]
MTQPTENRPLQKAWIVTDIEAAARRWSKALGVGPFFVAEYPPSVFDELHYRGAPGKLHMKTAIAYAGDEQIELVQPLGDFDCAYNDTVPYGQGGFHHLCFWTDDIDADVAHYESLGLEVANAGRMTDGGPRFAYVDASETLGAMIELLERRPALVELFDGWRDTCRKWDGAEAIVHL